MKKRMMFIFNFLWIALSLGCFNSEKADLEVKCIDIEANIHNMQQVKLSRLAKEIKYVALSEKSDIVFRGVWDCVFAENYFIAKDMSKCISYNYQGNILTIIGSQGRGPGEYQYVNNVTIGQQNKIFIQSLYDLLEYDISGKYLNYYKNCFLVDNNYIGSWSLINDTLIFGKVSSLIGNEINKAVVITKQSKVIHEFKNYIEFTRDKAIARIEEYHANIYCFNNEFFFKEMFNDTLFYLSKQFQLRPRYVVNLGKYAVPISFRKLLLTPENPYMAVNNIYQTSDYIFLDCNFGSHFPAKRITPKIVWEGIMSDVNTTNVLGIYNIQSNSLVFCEPTSTDNPLFTSGIYNDVDAGPRFYPMKQVNDSTLAMWIEAKQLKDHVASKDFMNSIVKYPEKKKELEILASSLKETDNPILMLVRLKK
jgi:hypothetical protein